MGSEPAGISVEEAASTGSTKLAVLLSMAMFVLVFDTSLMNVSISYVVHDLNATASGVQGTIALEALVSAAFILIGSKIGDLIGRRRAYVLGLLGYAAGALAMTLANSLVPVIIFWAVVGGLGASLLLPAMQSLIHGNFSGPMQRKAYALVGASAAIAAAVGPLLGGFITTYLSWRVGFGLELVIIAIVLVNIRLVKEVPYTGPRQIDPVGAVLSAVGMGGIVLGILVWQEGGSAVGALLAVGATGLGSLVWWLRRRKRAGEGGSARSRALQVEGLPARDHRPDAPADRARRPDDRAPDLPPDGLRVHRDGSGPDDRTALARHVRDCARRRQAGGQAPPGEPDPRRLRAARDRRRGADPHRPPGA